MSGYRTVSGPAVQVISGSIPIDLLAFERKKLWALKNERIEEGESKLAARDIKEETIRQRRDRWTVRLIKGVAARYSRNFG